LLAEGIGRGGGVTIAAIDMITRAYRLANVINANEVPDAEQGVTGLEALNDMMTQWDGDGIKLGWTVVGGQADTLPLQRQDYRAVRFNLAVELAGEFGIDPLPRVAKIASETYVALAKRWRFQVESSLELLPDAAAQTLDGLAIDSGGF
jgi:hypothetical protein